MKLCFSTLGCPGKGIDEIIKLAQNFKMDAVELRGVGNELTPSKTPEFSKENIKYTKEKFIKNNIKPISLNLSFTCHAVGKNDDEINNLFSEFEIAKALEIPYIRIFGDVVSDDRNKSFGDVLYALKGACKLAKNYGLTILLEVHGDFNTVENLKPIIDAMKDEKNFGLIWDIAHSDIYYGNDWLVFYEYIKPYIKHIHIKDHIRTPFSHTDIGKGEVPIKNIVEKVLSDGYDGYFSLEWEKRWAPQLSEIEIALKDFKQILK